MHWFVLAVIIVVIFVGLCRLRRSLKIDHIKERCVLITGCDTGFGRRLALRLDSIGVQVYAGCLHQRSVKELQDTCSGRLLAVHLDVTKWGMVRTAVEIVKNDLGNRNLWALVNNAGITQPFLPFEWTTKADVQDIFDVNILGMYDVTLAFLPLIRRAGEGRIVNMSSMGGRITNGLFAGYVMSKSAVEAFSDGLAYEVQQFGVTVHTIEPTIFRTGINRCHLDKDGYRRRLEMLDEEKKRVYGEETIEARIRTMQKCVGMGSDDLDLVVDTYVHAILSRHPYNRYVVGNRSGLIKFISLLPFTWQKWIMLKCS